MRFGGGEPAGGGMAKPLAIIAYVQQKARTSRKAMLKKGRAPCAADEPSLKTF
jgi:hypothetical protein